MKVNLDELVKDRIIGQDTADLIRTYYLGKTKPNDSSTMVRIISIIGVTLVGLGLMLIIAYNWDSMPDSLRLATALLPLVIAQVIGAYSLWHSKNDTWRESSALSILFGIGIAMALISQIYQMDSSLQDFLQWWICLAIPLIYIFHSGVTSLAVWIGIGWYITAGSWDKTSHQAVMALLFLSATIIPYALKGFHSDRSATWSWHHWLVPLVCTIYLFSLSPWMCSRLSAFHFLVLAMLFVSVGQRTYFVDRPLMNGYYISAFLGIWIIAFFLSFGFFWTEVENKPLLPCIADAHWLLPILSTIVMVGLGYKFYQNRFQSLRSKLLFYMILTLTLVTILGGSLGTLGQLLVNIIIICSIAWLIFQGIQTQKLITLNTGLLALAVWIICRFFESDISFAWRGVAFIALGSLCFSLNYVLLKRKKA